MQLLLKFTLRNISAKPLRTAVILLCLTAVSLTFSLCLTISIASGRVIEDQVRRGTGKADIILFSAAGLEGLSGLPEGTQALPVLQASAFLQVHSIDNYKYVQKKNVTVLGLETAKAQDFAMIPACEQPQEDETVISYAMAQRFGYAVGDTLVLPCRDGSQIMLTVSEVVLNSRYLSVVPLTVIVSPETAAKLLSVSTASANAAYVDVTDDSSITAVTEQLRAQYPELEIQQIMGTDESAEMVSGLTSTFLLLFVVTLLMIVFIISAFSKNIAAERLAAIGTLRSIGAEQKTAASTLLLECAAYGIAGGVLGGVLFYALKDTLVGGILPATEGFGGGIVYAPLYIPLAGLLLAVSVSCIFSLSSVWKASKMPLRDSIFGGKEAVCKPSAAIVVIGAVLAVGSAGMHVTDLGFVPDLFSLAAFVTGICLVIPMLLSLLSGVTAKHTKGAKCPVLRLAVIQSGTKKAVVTGTVICTAAMLLSASLYVLASSVDQLYAVQNYDCDIIISALSERADRYKIITSDKSELLYHTEENAGINGSTANLNLFGYQGFEMFSGISSLPEMLHENEIAFDKAVMKRLGIAEGDTVTLTLKRSTVRPVTLELTAVAGCDSIYYDMRCNAAVLSLSTYISVYHDYPSELLLKTEDAALAIRQLTDSSAVPETAEAYYARLNAEGSPVTTLLYGLAALGILLAVISVCGNQTIGFAQRKHELAVFRSQGMSIGQLSKMLFTEALLTATVPVAVLAAAGNAVMAMIVRILDSLALHVPISYAPAELLVLVGIMAAAVVMTSLIPVRSLQTMNTAAELKQE